MRKRKTECEAQRLEALQTSGEFTAKEEAWLQEQLEQDRAKYGTHSPFGRRPYVSLLPKKRDKQRREMLRNTTINNPTFRKLLNT
jgi:hypothetical protein